MADVNLNPSLGKLIIKDGIAYAQLPDESLHKIGEVANLEPLRITIRPALLSGNWDEPPNYDDWREELKRLSE